MRKYSKTATAPRFALCPPSYFEVCYSINAWMDPARWARNSAAMRLEAARQWKALSQELAACSATVELSQPADGVPDQVFMANSAVVLDEKAVLGRFRHPERRPEEPIHRRYFEALLAQGIISDFVQMPEGLSFEGTGDCIWDSARNIFWAGHGPRSDSGAAAVVADCFQAKVISLELVGDRYYHLDTCFAPLPGGEVMAYRPAFTERSWVRILDLVEADLLVEASDEDAHLFALNAIAIESTIITSGMTDGLRRQLQERGYDCRLLDLSPFLLAGGGAFCLVLRLDQWQRETSTSAA